MVREEKRLERKKKKLERKAAKLEKAVERLEKYRDNDEIETTEVKEDEIESNSIGEENIIDVAYEIVDDEENQHQED